MKLRLKVPPAALGLAAILLIWLVNRFVPIYNIKFGYQNSVSGGLILIGIIVALSGVYAFIKRGTSLDPRHPEKAHELVIIGIYNYSRNPMYLGLVFVIVGIAIYFGAVSSLFIIFLFIIYINKYQIVPEEIALQKKFGEDYTNYTQNVRRWL